MARPAGSRYERNRPYRSRKLLDLDVQVTPRQTIQRESLVEAAVARIRDMIVEGGFAPGARLQERVLCQLLDISRTPLREALHVLAAEGLVELLPSRGATVRRMSVAEILNTFEVIGVLDALAGKAAAGRMADAEIARVEGLHDRMRASFAARDLPSYFKLNQAIHRAIVAAAGNPVLERELRALNAQVQPYRYNVNLGLDSWQRSMRDHEKIIAYLRARDGRRLAALLRTHLPRKRDVIRQAFVAGDDDPRPLSVSDGARPADASR
jgi:DNA-binding GntR family transcriptional regulator